ncbi:MAG: NAD-dependent epimerase/dehydratase family protein [Promethearchaeota archaeon]|nr:MAG: NAD-dependent epimerase/dehydratase family protein [Candidatus Lokiarchaeota archaeon]
MKIKDRKILITGGAGFIGSHLVDRFLEEGADQIVVYDNFSTGLHKYLEGKPIDIVNDDILNTKKLDEVMKGIDIVSHHAAELEVFTGINNTLHDLRINIEGTFNVLNTAYKNRVQKFIYASSGGVYGQAEYIPEPEDHPIRPHWPYGVSKLAGEKYCLQYYLLYNFSTVALRYGIVYGPREWYGRVLTIFIKRALEGKAPIIFGDGEQRRDYIYIDDIVEANILAIKSESTNGKVFNVGGGKSFSINQVADTVLKLMEIELKPIYDNPEPGESSKFQPNRRRLPGELRDFILDNTFIKKTINFHPKVDFMEGVKREINWIRNFPENWNYKPRV